MGGDRHDLYEQLVHLEWLLRRYRLQNYREYGPMADPHRGQGRVLALLKLKPDISQKELSSILDIRSQSLGELLAKLERSGYISRTPSEADRRVIEIHLTDAGKRASDLEERQPDSNELFGCLDEKEQDVLYGYLTRVIDDLAKKLGEDGFDFGNRMPFAERFGEYLNRGGPHPGAGRLGGRPDLHRPDRFWGGNIGGRPRKKEDPDEK